MTAKPDRPLTAAELSALRDDDIDYSDIPELDDDFWDNAYIRYPTDRKVQLTLRLDDETVEWFRAQGKGHQTLMNAVLRSWVQRRKKREKAAAE